MYVHEQCWFSREWQPGKHASQNFRTIIIPSIIPEIIMCTMRNIVEKVKTQKARSFIALICNSRISIKAESLDFPRVWFCTRKSCYHCAWSKSSLGSFPLILCVWENLHLRWGIYYAGMVWCSPFVAKRLDSPWRR